MGALRSEAKQEDAASYFQKGIKAAESGSQAGAAPNERTAYLQAITVYEAYLKSKPNTEKELKELEDRVKELKASAEK